MVGCVVNERKGNPKVQSPGRVPSMCTCVRVTGEGLVSQGNGWGLIEGRSEPLQPSLLAHPQSAGCAVVVPKMVFRGTLMSP